MRNKIYNKMKYKIIKKKIMMERMFRFSKNNL